ncbi:MAG: LysM peptidoglycan-binding domain-containing protein [bacterium]|nr:LysM peptidoglycan-binding domain-containing protein [Candidatus Limimorpha equi]
MKKIILIFLLAAFMPLLADAQVVVERSKEIITVGGVEYYMHHVKQGETLYSISKAYHVSIEEIAEKNPEVNDGLQAEMVLGIPVVDFSEEETQPAQNVVENKVEEPQIITHNDGGYTVSRGENLYTIAKKFGIDLADFKAINPGLTNEPAEGTVIKVPSIRNEEEYLVHKVELSEKTSSLLKKWKVDEDAFRALNPAVGSHVFSDQIVLIPIEKVEIIENPAAVVDDEEEEEPIASETPVTEPIIVEEEPVAVSNCSEKSENAHEHYKVALLIPLYLGEVNDIDTSPESLVKSRKARPLSFLQFYEGFMLAIDSLTKHYGLNLDLTVIDVTENMGTAQNAVKQLEKQPFDLIVGPFFSKSFGVVQEYAKEHKTLIVNPLSTRENIVEGNPYVVKLKPNAAGQLSQLASLVNQYFGDSNVSIISQSSISEGTTAYLDEMERLLNLAINSEVVLTTDDFMRYAQNEGRRLELGNKLPSTIEVEGQIYATKDLKNGAIDNVRVENSVGRYVYNSGDMSAFTKSLSEVRNNLVIAYGTDNVFATQILNKLNKTAETHPITLVAMPDWSDLDKLLVENLLKMNAIYFSDDFVDYNSNEAKRFVLQFRRKYSCEPTDYAFSGFDVAWYFMNAMMRYGHEPKDCLLNFEMPLLSNSFRFVKTASENGLENYQWSIYQYDNENVELKPINLSETGK